MRFILFTEKKREGFLKPLSISLISLLLFSAATASAQYSKYDEERPNQRCSPPAKKSQNESSSDSLSAMGSRGLDLSGELLYWKPFEGGTEYASDYDGLTMGNHSYFIDFAYHVGYRIGLAYHLPYEGWKIASCFTSLHSTASNHLTGSFFPNGLYQAIPGVSTVTDAAARFDLHYDVFDLQFGKEQSFGRSFLWTPFFGLKGALIHQDFHFDYSGGLTIPSGSIYSAITKNNFNGIGLQGGIHAEWVLGAGFRILSGLSGSLLWGKFDLIQHHLEAADEVHLDSDFYRYSPNANLMVALSYGGHVSQKTYFGASLGFESQYWWRQNQTPVFTSATQPIYFRASEDFTVQGLDASVYLNY
jgi:hypothetical protein